MIIVFLSLIFVLLFVCNARVPYGFCSIFTLLKRNEKERCAHAGAPLHRQIVTDQQELDHECESKPQTVGADTAVSECINTHVMGEWRATLRSVHMEPKTYKPNITAAVRIH